MSLKNTTVIKRNGQKQPFDSSKIATAIGKAFQAVDGHRDQNVIADVTSEVMHRINLSEDRAIHIEAIQDTVEKALMALGHDAVAKAYILYRDRQARLRQHHPDNQALADYIIASKYAAYNKAEGRREVWPEIVDRVQRMHIERFPELEAEIRNAFIHVLEKRVMPSMRSLQFAGSPIKKHNARLYNCTSTAANRLRVFQEVFYLLLCGSGVGVSIQYRHVNSLRPVVDKIDRHKVKHWLIDDSIEGWCDAIGQLIESYFITGDYVEFAYHLIRGEGKPLSSGGKAPGHLPLKRAIESMRKILDNALGRNLAPIEVYDMICHLSEAVLSGGIRRSSLIFIFSPEDSEMMYAKTSRNFRPAFGNDPGHNSHRQMSNNSPAMVRKTTTRELFDRVIKTSREYGDPGIWFTEDHDYCTNPCGEIGMFPHITHPKRFLESNSDESLRFDWRKASSSWCKDVDSRIRAYGHVSGVQGCNLTEVNVANCKSEKEFIESVDAAAFIGTLQAAYTDMPYLGPVTQYIFEREALLGVGLTGIMDNPSIGMKGELLHLGATTAVRRNRITAKKIGINSAARVTTVKPSGTSSLALGCVGSGIHPHHAKRYFRRVTANPNEPVAQEFKRVNPHMVEEKPNGDWSLVFPIEAADGAKTIKNMRAETFMDYVFHVYESWVKPGTADQSYSHNLTHNVSNTVVVRDDEWESVIEKLWQNRDRVAAMSFLSHINDHAFPFAPRQEVITEEDEAKWKLLISNYRPIDYSNFREEHDTTTPQSTIACEGMNCEIN